MTGAVGVVALAVYVRSLLPGIGFSGDAAKWQLLSKVGGIPHATGYPLYLALIQAFGSLVPIGTTAWRTNLFSALCAAAAVTVLYRLLRRLDLRWAVAAATALTFAFTTAFWTQAVVAEVYALHILFLVSILACLANWRMGAEQHGDRWLAAATVLVALSFGNHLTTVLVLPGVAWVLWSGRRRLRPHHLLWAVGAGALAASQYLYLLYLADVGAYVESPADDLDDLVRLVTGGPFKSQMLAFTPMELIRDRVPLLLGFLRDDFRILLVPMAYGLGRVLLGIRRPDPTGQRDILAAVALLGLGSAVYGLNFDVPDVIVFFLPLYLALAVFGGVGLDGMVAWTTARLPSRRVGLAVAATLAAIPLLTGLADYRSASQRGNVTDQHRIEQALADAGDHAVFLTDNYNHSEYLWYYLLAEGLGGSRDLDLVHEATPPMVEAYFAGQPGRVTTAVQRVEAQADTPDPSGGPALLTISRDQADAMADAGLAVTRQAPGLWRIDAPA